MIQPKDVDTLSRSIAKMTEQVNLLNAALGNTGKASGGLFSTFKSMMGYGGQKGLGSGGSNSIANSLGGFSTPISNPSSMAGGPGTGTTGNAGGGAAANGGMKEALFGGTPMRGMTAMQGMVSMGQGAMQVAGAVVSTVYNAIPDASGVVNRAGGYYQAALRSPGMNRSMLENVTFSALKGGMSGIGSDAQVANILANAGYVPGSKDYLSVVKQVRGAATYLGMENSAATSAIAGLQGGRMGAELYQYGVTTMNANGTSKSVGDIAKQLYNAMGLQGNTASSMQADIRSGYTMQNLAGMGMNETQQQMMAQAFVDIAAGKNPDLASAKSAQGNQNPFDPYFRMNTSSTGLQGKSEKNIISGLGAAAGTIETFNNAMGDTIASLAAFKGYLDGLSGNPQGSALKKGAQDAWGGIKKIAGGAMMLGGILLAPETGGASLALTAGGMVLAGSGGGGNPGYGSSFGGRNLNSGKYSNKLISAGYGARQAQGGNWDSTGGVHKGTDFSVPVGTPVIATKDGVVDNTTLSSDYGQAVIVNHGDGYSSIYAHLSNKEVSPGTRVLKGQEIGKSGKSGNASGPHLHYEVWKGNNNPVDPKYLKDASSPIAGGAGMLTSTKVDLMADAYVQGQIGMPIQGGGSVTTADNSSVSVTKGTGDKKTWASQLLNALGAPITDDNINALSTWAQREGGHWKNTASYNPLNTSLRMDGSYSMNSVGVQAYNSWEQGIQAVVATLTGSQADARGYTAIVNDLRSGASATQTLSDISNSAWVTGKTGQNSYNGFSNTGGGNPGAPGMSTPTSMTGNSVSQYTSVGTTPTANSRVVNFNVTLTDVSEAQALAWAKKIEAHLNDKRDISAIGN